MQSPAGLGRRSESRKTCQMVEAANKRGGGHPKGTGFVNLVQAGWGRLLGQPESGWHTLPGPLTPDGSWPGLQHLQVCTGSHIAVCRRPVELRSWKSARAQRYFFLLHSFLHSTVTDHTLHVLLWARPWGYREENHSPSPRLQAFVIWSFIYASTTGRPGWGEGCWVSEP